MGNPLIMRHYQNNPKLKASGVKIRYTEFQTEERIKCSMDPIYFMEKYIKIVHVDHGLIPFKMFDFQKKLVTSFAENRYTIGKLPRQCGKSTASVAFILWTVIFGPLQNIAILANKANTSKELLDKLQKCYENIPLWMQQGIVSWNRHSLEIENGSRVVAGATSSDAIRGNTFNIIFLDEFAFVPPHIAEEFFTSVFPTISSGDTTKLIMVSTPKGLNHFHKFWVNANKQKEDPSYNGYNPVEAHWSVVPGRDERWYKEQLAVLGPEKFDQEFGCEFLGSSATLISGSKLSMMSWIQPIHRSGNVDLYQQPIPDHTYVISVDSARGLNSDYSAFTVIDCTSMPYSVVAKYRSKIIESYVFPEVIHNVALYYNNAHLLIETNDVGKQVADMLHNDFEYEHIFSTQNIGRGGQKLNSGFGRSGKLGVATSGPMKKIGCSNLKALIETDKLLISDANIVDELTTFVRKADTFMADDGKHDDLVMTLVLFGWLTSQPSFKELTDTDIRKRISADVQVGAMDQVMPFGHISDGTEKIVEIDTEGNVWEDVKPEWAVKTQRFFNDVHYSMEDEEDDEFDGDSL